MFTGLDAEKSGRNCHELLALGSPPSRVLATPRPFPTAGGLAGICVEPFISEHRALCTPWTNSEVIFNSKLHVFKTYLFPPGVISGPGNPVTPILHVELQLQTVTDSEVQAEPPDVPTSGQGRGPSPTRPPRAPLAAWPGRCPSTPLLSQSLSTHLIPRCLSTTWPGPRLPDG